MTGEYARLNEEEETFARTCRGDVSILTVDGELKAHSVFLIHRCHYFKMMLSTNSNKERAEWREASSKVVDLTSIDGGMSVVWPLLVFIYTGKLSRPIESNVLAELAMVADRFLLTKLKEMSLIRLGQQVTLSNALQLLQISSILDCGRLRKTTITFITLNLDKFLRTNLLNEFLEYTGASSEKSRILSEIQTSFEKMCQKNNSINIFYTQDRKNYIEDFLRNISTNTKPKTEKKLQKTVEKQDLPIQSEPKIIPPIQIPTNNQTTVPQQSKKEKNHKKNNTYMIQNLKN